MAPLMRQQAQRGAPVAAQRERRPDPPWWKPGKRRTNGRPGVSRARQEEPSPGEWYQEELIYQSLSKEESSPRGGKMR